MKIGLTFFPVRPDFLMPTARRMDELGYDSLWLGEHLVFPTHIESQYPYADVGAPLPSTPLFDPLLTLTYIAAQTKQLQLATGVYVLPLRHPMLTAKNVATLDALSGGRTILAVGAGWLKEEFDAVGMPFEKRGARMEECIDIMRKLWTETATAHEGQFYSFAEVGFEPKPARNPVPILIGGESPIALKRAARYGDGWQGLNNTPEQAAGYIKTLRELRAGDPRPFEITVGHPAVPTLDELRRYRDAGVDRVTLIGRFLSGGQKTLEAMLDGVSRFADEVMRKVD
jgi:probable F420-dependent oxidoreductase